MIKHNTHPCQQNNENKDQKLKLNYLLFLFGCQNKNTPQCVPWWYLPWSTCKNKHASKH